MVAVGLQCTALAWSAALLGMGFPPARRDVGKVMVEIEQVALVRINQALARGGLDDERKAAAYITVVQRVQEIKESVKNPSDNLARTLLSKFSLRQDTQPMQTIADLVARGDEVATMELGPPPRAEPTRDEVAAVGGDE
jgi:hypothetical protein